MRIFPLVAIVFLASFSVARAQSIADIRAYHVEGYGFLLDRLNCDVESWDSPVKDASGRARFTHRYDLKNFSSSDLSEDCSKTVYLNGPNNKVLTKTISGACLKVAADDRTYATKRTRLYYSIYLNRRGENNSLFLTVTRDYAEEDRTSATASWGDRYDSHSELAIQDKPFGIGENMLSLSSVGPQVAGDFSKQEEGGQAAMTDETQTVLSCRFK